MKLSIYDVGNTTPKWTLMMLSLTPLCFNFLLTGAFPCCKNDKIYFVYTAKSHDGKRNCNIRQTNLFVCMAFWFSSILLFVLSILIQVPLKFLGLDYMIGFV
jgi:hypothetical protein